MREFNPKQLMYYEIDGVDSGDYPDFCDAFLGCATVYINDMEYVLTEEECDYITATYPEWINEQAFESLMP